MVVANPVSGTGPVSPTRQQLDELDDLIQQMLALPVVAADAGPEAVSRSDSLQAAAFPWDVVSPSSATRPEASASGSDPASSRSDDARNRRSPLLSRRAEGDSPPMPAETDGDRPERWERRSAPDPAASRSLDTPPRNDPFPSEVAPAPPPSESTSCVPAPPLVEEVLVDSATGHRARFGPLVWCNRAFDVGAGALGPVGRGFRGSVGRNVLGVAGIVLVVGSAAWAVAEWLGWTR